MQFSQLGLSAPLLKAVTALGYTSPSPIQEQAIPVILSGKDVLAAAQTGTGKTAGFALPIMEKLAASNKPRGNSVRALILTPTRELAAQVEDNIRGFNQFLNLKSTVVFGGVGINPQMKRLRGGSDILVATPGRLLDLYQQNAVKFDQLEVLVLDEADRMLDMGFIHDIKRVLKLLPAKRQNLMFSATFNPTVTALAESITQSPVKISVTPPNTTVEEVQQRIVNVDKTQKVGALTALIKRNAWSQTLVFSRTKHGANRIADKLTRSGIPSAAIHGNKSQGARTRALAEFKDGTVKALIATDIAARGIDIAQLPVVVNVDLPNTAADYVHRIGRTGRAGASGQAWSLVSADELQELKDVETLIQQLLPRETLEGFEPSAKLAETKLSAPKKTKKPKKPKQPGVKKEGGEKRADNARPARRKPARRRPQRAATGSHAN